MPLRLTHLAAPPPFVNPRAAEASEAKPDDVLHSFGVDRDDLLESVSPNPRENLARMRDA